MYCGGFYEVLGPKTSVNRIMRVARYRNIIVALLMVVFVGQTVASSAISCLNEASQSQHHEQVINSSAIGHSHHASINSANDLDSFECCTDCDCCLGGCSTAMLPAVQQTFLSNGILLIDHYLSPAKNQLAVALYRPPISR